jgi:hypothetical protein
MTATSSEPTARQFDDYVLDENTLTELAALICGDDGPYHRQGWQLPSLLERAGWKGVPEYDRTPRRAWIAQHLRARKDEPGALAALIRRLADSREYLDDPPAAAETVRQLNELLAHEGFRIRVVNGRGVVEAIHTEQPEHHAPTQLTTTVAALVHDPAAAQALQRRLEEARACQDGGAHLSAIIMMGSLLEGVLVEVLTQRAVLGPSGARTPLQNLITLAHAHGYIDRDAHDFTQILREYRNLVHVHKQIATGHKLDGDTARVCWWVVVGALNDLAKTVP